MTNARRRKAGRKQFGSLAVFCFAAFATGWTIIDGSYGYAAVGLFLMGVNFRLYQENSRIIERELEIP